MFVSFCRNDAQVVDRVCRVVYHLVPSKLKIKKDQFVYPSDVVFNLLYTVICQFVYHFFLSSKRFVRTVPKVFGIGIIHLFVLEIQRPKIRQLFFMEAKLSKIKTDLGK